VWYDYNSSAILKEPISKSGPQILATYKRAIALLARRGLEAQLENLDNEASAALQQFMSSVNIDYQLAPMYSHRRKFADVPFERSKITSSPVCAAPTRTSRSNYGTLLPQALLTLNLLRDSSINPKHSAQAQLHDAFYYNRMPLATPGTRYPGIRPREAFNTWHQVSPCCRRLVPRPCH
jgi:hypothetical protein